jgi:hypothetical protein
LGVIRGSKEGVQLAKLQLLKCVEEYGQLETSEIFVSEVIVCLDLFCLTFSSN